METDKLELKHLVGYLPYGLKALGNCNYHTIIGFKNETYFIEGGNNYAYGDIIDLKPILRPLSDLTKEIDVNGEKFVPIDRLFGSAYRIQGFEHYLNVFNGGFELTITKGNKTIYADFNMYQKLYEWHFDIHGLIPLKLAININTLNHGK